MKILKIVLTIAGLLVIAHILCYLYVKLIDYKNGADDY